MGYWFLQIKKPINVGDIVLAILKSLVLQILSQKWAEQSNIYVLFSCPNDFWSQSLFYLAELYIASAYDSTEEKAFKAIALNDINVGKYTLMSGIYHLVFIIPNPYEHMGGLL